MGILSLFFIALTFALPLLIAMRSPRAPISLMFLAAIIHTTAVATQDKLLKSTNSDAHLYYYDLDSYMAQPIQLGTSLIVYSTYWLKTYLNASFTDLMYLFGMAGSAAIMLLLNFIASNPQKGGRFFPYCACFLPGLHFWTSSIGKDSLIALGMALAVTSVTKLPQKILGFIIGIGIIMLIRTHIAIILLGAFGIAKLMFDNRIGGRITLLALAALSMPAVYFATQSFLGINILNLNELSSFFQDRQTYVSSSEDQGVTFIANPFARLGYFLLRPFFFDANNLLALIASFENLALLLVVGRLMFLWSRSSVAERVTPAFLLLFTISLSLFLGFTGYNVGLALRQKVMVYPAIVILLTIMEASSMLHTPMSARRPRTRQTRLNVLGA